MIVSIKAEIFNNPSNHSDLNDLMHFFRKGKHRIHLKKKEDFDAFENSKWTETISRSDRDTLRESISRIDKKEIIVSEKSNDIEFNLKEAVSYLEQNLRIIIEHEEYEKPFFLKIFQEFDTSSELIKSLQKGWLDFYNGAGSNSESVLRTRITRNITTNQHFKDPLNKYLRFYELKDSDREYCTINSDGTITEQKLPESKTKFLTDNKVPFHILYKREKENYIPDCIFNIFLQTAKMNDSKKKFSKIYLSLTCHQKDFFDLEKGFIKPKSNPRELKERNNLKDEVKELYKDLTEQKYRTVGFGLPFSNFKSELSKYFEYATRIDFEKRIQHQPKLKSKVNPNDNTERNEFEHIVHEIKYLL